MSDHQLQKLLSRWLDGVIQPEELHALQVTLKESASARRIYLATMSVHAELCNSASAREHLQKLTEGKLALGDRDEPPGNSLPIVRQKTFFFAIAAGLLLALGLWQGNRPWKQELAQSPATGKRLILRKIEPLSAACRWYVEHERREQAESYRSGDIIHVTRGKLNLHYINGIKVVLHSTSAYQLISDMNARVLLGRLTVTVSEAGIGFSVITPRATVIDLGTEFGIEVNNDGATDVIVFKGEVDVDYHNDEADQLSAQRLRMGEAVHLDATGTASRIVSITNSTYSSQLLRKHSRPLVISEVRDNIVRTSLLNFYEIVHGGMDEDVLAYVDRLGHQYNGVTEEGMPPYLIGGDYVKMFNNDKIIQDIQIRVELAVPARLYILIDDRLTLPQWLCDNFQDTGDNIGIDRDLIGVDRGHSFPGGRWQEIRTPLGVGPGASVEDTLSVWVRKITDAGVVTLGGTEDHKDGTENYKDGSNMFGIVAVPLGITD